MFFILKKFVHFCKMKKTPQFISMLSDYGFKATFGNESDTLFLKTALTALIQSETPIKDIVFLRNEFIGSAKESRAGLYDLMCQDENGHSFIVEMQLGPFPEFIQRAKFYAFQRFNTLIRKGEFDFGAIPKIYCIGFLAKMIYPFSEQYYHFGMLKNQFGETMDNQLMHIIVEISKFDKKPEEIESNLDTLSKAQN